MYDYLKFDLVVTCRKMAYGVEANISYGYQSHRSATTGIHPVLPSITIES